MKIQRVGKENMSHNEECNQSIELGLEISQTIKLVYRNVKNRWATDAP